MPWLVSRRRRHHADYATEKDDNTWSAFYDANAPMLCPSCARRSAKHCVHVHEYLRLTRQKRRTRHYKNKTPCAVRDELRDELWDALTAPLALDTSDTAYIDMLVEMGFEHPRVATPAR